MFRDEEKEVIVEKEGKRKHRKKNTENFWILLKSTVYKLIHQNIF